MPSPFGNATHLAANLAAESAKLEKALDDQIGKLGSLKASPPPTPPGKVRLRKATVLLLAIGLTLACLAAFSFGFLAAFH